MDTSTGVIVQDTKSSWIFIASIGNLELTDDVENEYRMNRVTFISGAKLRRIFKRLKLDKSYFLKPGFPLDIMLASKQTFAFLYQTGKPSQIRNACLNMVQSELEMLAASQLYYCRRNQMSWLGLSGDVTVGINKHAFLDTRKNGMVVGSALSKFPSTLTLDRQWKKYHRVSYFSKFLRILQGRTHVNQQWKDDITRSVQLVGKSTISPDIGSAFLWNMIALELLITRQGDKYSDVIPKRIEALLGWIGFWNTSNFKERIDDAYQLRCKVVHDGRLDLVKPADLLFTEDLLINVLFNILRHPKLFQCKDDVINFAELVSAEHLLGQKSRIRPKTLMFIKRSYTTQDYDL